MKKIIALSLGICAAFSLGACSKAPSSPAYQGDALIEEPVQSISLDWSSAPIEIVYGDVDGICLTETASTELEKDQQMQWYVDGTTLYVRQYTGQQLLQFGDTGKRLKITIPTDARLDALDINASSASVDTEVDVNTLHIATSSGKIHASAENPEYAELSTSSGDVELTADSLRTLAVHTSSGSIDVTANAFEHAKLDASSGNISLSLPEESDFSADISTASGTFASELPLKNIEEFYVCGDGENVLTLSTSSGNISLKKME